MSAHDCTQQGHVWREGKRPDNAKDYPQRPLYARHRDRTPSVRVAVFCQHCPATTELEVHARNTAPPTMHNGPSR